MLTEDMLNVCSLTYVESYLFEFDSVHVTNFHYNLCNKMVEIENSSSLYLLHFMLIFEVVLIFLTLISRTREEAKWFIFHIAMLNLILAVIWEVIYFFPEFSESPILLKPLFFLVFLSKNSIFPLAFTRLLFLYRRKLYKKMFTVKKLAMWLLGYDCFMLFLFYLGSPENRGAFFTVILNLFLLFSTILCSIFIFIKVNKMMKFVEISLQLCTYNDLRRATFICLFQTFLNSIHMVSNLYTYLFVSRLKNDQYLFDKLYVSYIILASLNFPIFQLFMILDSLMSMFVLRSYRQILGNIYHLVFKDRERNLRVMPTVAPAYLMENIQNKREYVYDHNLY